jgi:hypothetical protein
VDHRVITFYELSGTDDAAQVMRTMITEGRVRLGTVVKDASLGLTAQEIDKPADGVVVITTTTLSALDHELETRVIRVELTHDQELARQVYELKMAINNGSPGHNGSSADDLDKRLETQTKTGSGSPGQPNEIYHIWQVADHLLELLGVVIPYGQRIAELFPVREERY